MEVNKLILTIMISMVKQIYSSLDDSLKESFFFQLFIKNCDSLKELHSFVFSYKFFIFSFLVSLLIFSIFYIISKIFFNTELKMFLLEIDLSLNENNSGFYGSNVLHKILRVFIFVDFLFPHFIFLKQLIVLEKLGAIVCFIGPFISFFCDSVILNLFYFYFYFVIIKAIFFILFYKRIKTFKNVIISKDDNICLKVISKFMGNMDKATKNAVILVGGGLLVSGIFTGADIFEQKVTLDRKLAFRKESIAIAKEAHRANLSAEDIIKISNDADKSFDLIAKNTSVKKVFSLFENKKLSKIQEDEIRRIVKDSLKDNYPKKP